MPELTGAEWSGLLLAALLVGLNKAGVAGLVLVAVPLLAAVFPARASTGTLLVLLIMGDALAVSYYRRHARRELLLALLPPALVGVLLGWLVMGRITDAQLRGAIGAVILSFVALSIWRGRAASAPATAGRGLSWLAGIAAGFTTMLANAAGPIVMVYLLLRRVSKEELIGTVAWFFFLTNLAKLPLSVQLGLITPESAAACLATFPVILAGGVVGVGIVRRVSPAGYARWIQLLATASAAVLLLG